MNFDFINGTVENPVYFQEVAWNAYGGFQGTFDGCGYSIDGINFNAPNGFIGGVLGHKGVVKNLAFTSGIVVGYSNIVAQNNYGTIENVYVQINKMMKGTANNGSSGFSLNTFGGATVRNVFVDVASLDYTKSTVDAESGLNMVHNAVTRIQDLEAEIAANGPITVENVVTITSGEEVFYKGSTGTHASVAAGTPYVDSTNNIYGYYDATELKAASATIKNLVQTQFDSNIWGFNDNTGRPYFKSYYKPDSTADLLRKSALIGESMTLTFSNGGYHEVSSFAFDKAYTGVSVSGRTVTVTADATPNTKTYIVATFLDGSTKQYEFYIRAKEYPTVSGKAYLDRGDQYVNLDLAPALEAMGYGDKITVVGNAGYSYLNEDGSATVTGTTFTNYTYEGTVAKIPVNKLLTTGGKQLSGEVTVTFSCNLWQDGQLTGYANVTANVILVTKVLRTSADLDGWFALAEKDWTHLTVGETDSAGVANGNYKTVRYGGYYELGNNITYTGSGYTAPYAWFYGCSSYWGKSGGFQGTFDGCGYTIDGLKFAGGQIRGFFGGVVGQRGVIKNVAFTNVQQSQNNSNVIGQNLYGSKVENVYVHLIKLYQGDTPNGSSAYFFNIFTGSVTNNVVVKVDSLNYTPASLTATQKEFSNVIGRVDNGVGNITITNTIAITAGEATICNNSGDTEVMSQGTMYGYNTYADAVADKATYANTITSMLNAGVWKLNDDGFPVFKSMGVTNEAVLTNGNATATVVAGTSVSLDVDDNQFFNNYGEVWSTSTAGVTVSGNTLTVPSDFEGESIEIIVTNKYGISASYTIAVVKANKVTGTAQKLETYNATQTVNVDTEGEIVWVNLAGKQLHDYTFVSGESITINNAEYNDVTGIHNLVMLTKNGDEYTETTVELDIATMFISNEEELLAFPTIAGARTYYTAWGKGLYVLDADIDWTDGVYVNNNNNANTAYSQSVELGSNGFCGTFDGRGHVIRNMIIGGTNGFIAGLASSGEKRIGGAIVNVSFVGLKSTSNLILGANSGGFIENVYVQATSTASGNVGLFADNYGVSAMKNVVVEFVGGNGNYYLQRNNINRGHGTYEENIYVVGALGTAPTQAGTQKDTDCIGVFANYTEMKNATTGVYGHAIDYTTMDNDFWDIVNGLPVPVALKSSAQTPVIIDTVGLNERVGMVTNAGVYFDYAVAGEGITTAAGRITVTDALAGQTVNITVTNMITGETVTKASQVEALTTYEVVGNVSKIDAETAIALPDSAWTNSNNQVLSIALNGNALNNYTIENGEITLYNAEYGSLANKYKSVDGVDNYHSLALRTQTETGEHIVNVKLHVADMIIMNKADLYRFSQLERGTLWGEGKVYILGANIDYEGDEYSINVNVSGNNYVTTTSQEGVTTTGLGFAGTFDGCGYIINNIHITNNGFISGIRMDGVFKNVSFTNAKQSATGFITRADPDAWTNSCGGTITNVYVQVESLIARAALFACGNYGNSKWSNVVVDVTDKSGTYGLVSHCYHKNYGAYTNVYGINLDAINTGTSGGTSTGVDVVQVFADFAAFKAGGNDFNGNAINYTAMDNDFWDIVNGVPVPVALKGATIYTAENEVWYAGETVIPTGATAYKSAMTSNKVDAYIETIGDKITILPDSPDGFVDLTLTSHLGYTTTKSIVVKSVVGAAYMGAYDYDLNDGVDLSYDFTSKLIGDEVIKSVTIDGLRNKAIVNGNTLKIARDKLNRESMLGEHTISVYVDRNGDVYRYDLTLTVCTKVIRSKEDLNNLENYRILTNDSTYQTGVGYYVLATDIDMAGTRLAYGQWDSSVGHTIPSMYRSTFDGRGKTISNVKQTGNASALFAYGNNCTVKNVNFVNVDIADTCSLLVYDCYGTTKIENVFIQGKVTRNAQSYSPSSFIVGKSRDNVIMNNVYIVITEHNLTDVADDLTSGAGDTFFGAFIPKFKVYGGTATLTNCHALNVVNEESKGKVALGPAASVTYNNTTMVYNKDDALAITDDGSDAYDKFVAYANTL